MSDKGRTLPHGSSWDDETTRVEQAPPDFEVASAPVESNPRPPVEVEARQISPAALRHVQHAFEIWTKNRVYNLDSQLVCIGVIDLATGRDNRDHPFVGARLVGGQLKSDEGSELTYPLPVPGSDAVFQKSEAHGKIRLSVTSKVSRVILHVKRVKVRAAERDVAWGTITSSGAHTAPR